MRVFLSSPWVPAEWVRAHGHTPRGLWFAPDFRATLPVLPALPAGTCMFAEQVVQFALRHPQDAVVFTTACDQLRRGFDHAAETGAKQIFLFNLPATQTPAAARLYRAELERLGQFLRERGGVAPAPENLRREMRQAEDIRRRLRASAPQAEARSFAAAVAKFWDEGIFSAPAAAPAARRVPLALAGGPFSAADWPLWDAIETAGGRVVLNATLTGERSLSPVLAERDRPLGALDDLTAGYFEHLTDVFQRPNTRLYDWLQPRLAARAVRGIVLWHFTGCDLWRAEAQNLREAFGLPVLPLEAGETPRLAPRDATRLQAFVETLENDQ